MDQSLYVADLPCNSQNCDIIQPFRIPVINSHFPEKTLDMQIHLSPGSSL